MPTDDDYERDPELMAAVDHFAIAQLGKVLDGATGGNPAKLEYVRRAAVEICRRAGILDILRAVSADGVLRPPPSWPAADIVPVGGGLQLLVVAVRTAHGARVVQVQERIKIVGKPTQDQLENAYDRGYFRLRKLITKEECNR
jgi:hypothetical protein